MIEDQGQRAFKRNVAIADVALSIRHKNRQRLDIQSQWTGANEPFDNEFTPDDCYKNLKSCSFVVL